MVSGRTEEKAKPPSKLVEIAKQSSVTASKKNGTGVHSSLNGTSQLNNNIIKEEDNEHIEE